MNRQIFSYLLGIFAALSLTLLLIVLVMDPPVGDLLELGILLGITAIASGAVGYVSHRLGWWRRFKSLTQALAVSYLIAGGLTMVNVWLTARLMFINSHDLALATLLLLFASSISVLFGVFIAGSATQVLRDLVQGAERLGRGDFSTRIEAVGEDEVAQLAKSFNEMVHRLETADASEKALEEARRNLIAWASHDLRTPLASLRAMLDALADGVVTDEATIQRYLQQSQVEIERMSRLINDLFELAQLDAGSLELQGEAASLSDLISDTLERFTARARQAGILLKAAAQPEIDPVWMAPDKIERVLNNLLENALRHTPAGGEISLQAGMENGDVHVSVSDSGLGIPEEDLPRIFDRFFRGEKSRTRQGYESGGSGLGLAIARGIVEAHGGNIWAHNNTPGPGSVFHFTLPRQGQPQAPQQA